MTEEEKVAEVEQKLDRLDGQYCLSIPLEVGEKEWDEAGIEYECVGAGCGSAEYTFKSKYARDRAATLFARNIHKYVNFLDSEGDIVNSSHGE